MRFAFLYARAPGFYSSLKSELEPANLVHMNKIQRIMLVVMGAVIVAAGTFASDAFLIVLGGVAVVVGFGVFGRMRG